MDNPLVLWKGKARQTATGRPNLTTEQTDLKPYITLLAVSWVRVLGSLMKNVGDLV
jgi:hypothetical protein